FRVVAGCPDQGSLFKGSCRNSRSRPVACIDPARQINAGSQEHKLRTFTKSFGEDSADFQPLAEQVVWPLEGSGKSDCLFEPAGKRQARKERDRQAVAVLGPDACRHESRSRRIAPIPGILPAPSTSLPVCAKCESN